MLPNTPAETSTTEGCVGGETKLTATGAEQDWQPAALVAQAEKLPGREVLKEEPPAPLLQVIVSPETGETDKITVVPEQAGRLV